MSGQLIPQLLFQGWSPNGGFLSGGLLFTYAAGTNIPATVYGDPGLTGALTNPVILNSLGEALIYLTPGQAYKFNLTDSNGNQIPGYPVDQVNSALSFPSVNNFYTLGTPTFSWAAVYVNGAPVPSYPISASETAASVIPTALQYIWGNVLRYGADPTGTADSTTAINNALLSNASVYIPSGTYLISASLNVQSNQTVHGDGSQSIITCANGAITNFSLSSITRAFIRDLKISVTGTGFVGEAAGIYLLNATYCVIESVEMVGCNWSGVWMDAASNYNTVRKCYFHGFSEPAGSGGDVRIYSAHGAGTTAPAYNIIEDNVMYGGGGFGVGIEDPDSASQASGFPQHNLVQGNRIGAHLTYGMLNYMPGNSAPSTNTGNQFIGNYVENISGLCPTNNSSGAGFYQVGVGGGATQVIGNEFVNCCTNTMNRSLAPAGIGIAGLPTGLTPPVIMGNTVTNMTQGDGILITSCLGPTIVEGNSVTMPSNNNGTGPGGSTMQGNGININASSSVTLGPNTVQMFGPGAGLLVFAAGVNCANVSVNGGSYSNFATGTGNPVQTAQTGGFNVTQFQMTGVTCSSLTSADAFNLSAIISGTLVGCTGASSTGRGLFINACQVVRVTGGEYSTSGTVAIGTGGTCTGSFIDKSCFFGAASGLIHNAGTGCIIEWYVANSTIPTTGTFAVGDHAIPIAPAVGSPKGWFTTVAGTPGTQSSEGNL